jgi:hypothetical protein
MPDDLSREQVQKQCDAFLSSLGKPAFMIFGWKKEDGTVDIVQLVRDMNPVEYVKGVSWAMHEVTKQL